MGLRPYRPAPAAWMSPLGVIAKAAHRQLVGHSSNTTLDTRISPTRRGRVKARRQSGMLLTVMPVFEPP
jgi:hypothetical protein